MRTAEGASEKQSSVKARLRNGLTYLLIIANSLLNPKIKNVENLQTLDRVMNGYYRWSFLTHSVYSIAVTDF